MDISPEKPKGIKYPTLAVLAAVALAAPVSANAAQEPERTAGVSIAPPNQGSCQPAREKTRPQRLGGKQLPYHRRNHRRDTNKQGEPQNPPAKPTEQEDLPPKIQPVQALGGVRAVELPPGEDPTHIHVIKHDRPAQPGNPPTKPETRTAE